MRDRIEADEHVRYVDVSIPGGSSITGRKTLTYHTYDPDLHEGDRVLICAGVLEGHIGTIVDDDCVAAPTLWHRDQPIYSYRCERAPEPTVAEVVLRWSDGDEMSYPATFPRTITTGGVKIVIRP